MTTRSGAGPRDISIGEMVMGGVRILHQQALDHGMKVGATDRGKALHRSLENLKNL
jgi:hypothetical protein